MNHKRVERIWRQEGLKVPEKQPKRARLWLANGSCVRRRPEYPNHVWAYDFVMERTQDGRPLKLLTVVDEYTRECLAIAVRRRLRSRDVQDVLSDLFLRHGCPTHIRSDHGPEFIARAVQAWYRLLTVAPLFIEPHSPWENGYVESFNGKLRDELLNRELFYTLRMRPKCSWSDGGSATTRSARTVHWRTGHRPQKLSRRSVVSRRDSSGGRTLGGRSV